MRQPTPILRAAFVAPMDAPMIRDGAVVTAGGRVVEVGPAGRVLTAHAGRKVADLGDAVLLPGLVNAHAHLELSLIRCPLPAPPPFVDWLYTVSANARRPDFEDWILTGMVAGVQQCIPFGVTCVGDICQHIAIARPMLFSMKPRPRVVSFAEVLGLAKRRYRFEELLDAAAVPLRQDDRFRAGLSPHAPYSVDRRGFEQALQLARSRELPIATHLAESASEREFLESHTGPFRELLDHIGSLEEPLDTFQGSPIAFARSIGLLDYERSSLAHVNYCDDEELAMLARGKASVVYCPRTHAYFGHPPHRWRDMLAAGINVAVGTDSCASSPDLNLVDDLRLLHRIAPDVTAESLWQMATTRSARAVCWDDEVGSITVGKRADFVAFRTSGASPDPLRDVLETDVLPTGTWMHGRRVFSRA